MEVVKQEMARVNVDILGISELKRTGMGEFNSDDHYIYAKAFDCVDHNKLWKILKEMGIPDPPDLPLETPVCRSGSNS